MSLTVSEPLPLWSSQAPTLSSPSRYPHHLGFTLFLIYRSGTDVMRARLSAPRWAVEVDTGMVVEMGVDMDWGMDADGIDTSNGHCHHRRWQALRQRCGRGRLAFGLACGVDIDTDIDTLHSAAAVALRKLFYLHPRNLQPPNVRHCSRCSAMENVLHCALKVEVGRVCVTHRLRFGFVPGFTPTPIPMPTPLPLAALPTSREADAQGVSLSCQGQHRRCRCILHPSRRQRLSASTSILASSTSTSTRRTTPDLPFFKSTPSLTSTLTPCLYPPIAITGPSGLVYSYSAPSAF
jgi:hypothetical protein